jgi:tetratricopeptide (TPR) repeat protein
MVPGAFPRNGGAPGAFRRTEHRLGGVRGAAILLLLAVAAAADPNPDPFAPTREDLGLADDAYARYIETLSLLKESLDRDPAGSLERAFTLLEPWGLSDRFEGVIAKAIVTNHEDGPERGGLLSLSGHLLVARAEQSGNVWVFGANGAVQRGGLDDQTTKEVKAAETMLRDAIRLRPNDARARNDLATALGLLDSEGNADEISRLRNEAAGLELRKKGVPPVPPPDDAATLRKKAEEIEQVESAPDHASALLLRKEALVRDFCARTIPFDYDPSLYGPLSLIAPEEVVTRNLTRTYLKRDGSIDSVPPTYHPAKPAERVRIVEGLGRSPGAAADAALLKVLATATTRDAVVEAALKALATGTHEEARKHMPDLLMNTLYHATVLQEIQGRIQQLRVRLRGLGVPAPAFDGFEDYGPLGQALLVEAAIVLDAKEAAPVLATLLPLEDDILVPRGIAAAIAKLGGPEEGDALLKVASDPSADIYFRREAVLALGVVAPVRLQEVPDEPHLAIALAAARYRTEPSEALRGRLLQGLSSPHEADDAARYMADLGIREALPEMEHFLETRKDDYAAPLVQAAHDRLAASH